MRTLILSIFCILLSGVNASEPQNNKVKTNEQADGKTLSARILSYGKTAQTKLQSGQVPAVELTTIINAGKSVETARLQAALELTKQQAALEDKKANKAALEAFESKRKAVNSRFNELIRLINQVEKNQKTALLSEKLNDLIVFLEPETSEAAQNEAAKAPPQTLSRGTALKP